MDVNISMRKKKKKYKEPTVYVVSKNVRVSGDCIGSGTGDDVCIESGSGASADCESEGVGF